MGLTTQHPNDGVEKTPTIRDLYPQLSEVQLQEAEENLRRYFAFALKMHGESMSSASPSLDGSSPSSRIKERSNNSLKI